MTAVIDGTNNSTFPGVDGTAMLQGSVAMPRMVLSTAQNTTSGSNKDFTGIPSWAKRVTLMLNGVSTSGTAGIGIRIGTGTTAEASGYSSTGFIVSATTSAATSSTIWLIGNSSVAARAISGQIVMTLMNASTNTWTISGLCAEDGFANAYGATGSKSISGSLGIVSFLCIGADTFDAGSVNILYEG